MTLHQMTFLDLLSITSSQELADGATPCDLQDGPTTSQCGQDHAHANLSARQARELGLMTQDTCGLPGTGSLQSVTLQQYLGNRLRQNLDGLGSTLYALTWKEVHTPPLVPICVLRASARPTQDPDNTGLPTPTGCSNGGKNHVVGRLDEWGGSSNPFRGTEIGPVRCASFEAWMMGYPMEWVSPTVLGMLSFRPLRKRSSSPQSKLNKLNTHRGS